MVLRMSFIQGEGKTKTFLIKQNGVAVDLTTYEHREYGFILKETKGGEALVIKVNDDFITTLESDGKIAVNFTTTDLDRPPKTYVAQLIVKLDNLEPSKNLDKSKAIEVIIEQEV